MTMSMYKKVCITNSGLVNGDFLDQIRRVAKLKPDIIIIREKEFSEVEYFYKAKEILKICKEHGILCYFNSRLDLAIMMKADGCNLSYNDFLNASKDKLRLLKSIGVSVHSHDEAVAAEKLGADYIIYGHVFKTDCKKGLKPRGLDALERICNSVKIPVFAVGGITEKNLNECIGAGALGVCMMSAYMQLKY